MNLIRVPYNPAYNKFVCINCHERFILVDKLEPRHPFGYTEVMWADADGKPYEAYYCPDCAFAIHAPLFTSCDRCSREIEVGHSIGDSGLCDSCYEDQQEEERQRWTPLDNSVSL